MDVSRPWCVLEARIARPTRLRNRAWPSDLLGVGLRSPDAPSEAVFRPIAENVMFREYIPASATRKKIQKEKYMANTLKDIYMYVYIYMYIYICIYIYIYIIYVCIYINIFAHMSVCMYLHRYVYIFFHKEEGAG